MVIIEGPTFGEVTDFRLDPWIAGRTRGLALWCKGSTGPVYVELTEEVAQKLKDTLASELPGWPQPIA